MLFIDARKLGHMVDRTRREFADDDIAKLVGVYHAWRGEKDVGVYEDIPGFCKAAGLEEIRAHSFILTPGRYVGVADTEDDDLPFTVRFAVLKTKLEGQFDESDKLTASIREKLQEVAGE